MNDNGQPNGAAVVQPAQPEQTQLPPIMEHAVYKHVIALNDVMFAAAKLIDNIIDEVGEEGLSAEEKMLHQTLQHPCLSKHKELMGMIEHMLNFVTPGPMLLIKKLGVGMAQSADGAPAVVLGLNITSQRQAGCYMNREQAEQIEKGLKKACDDAFGRLKIF